MMSNFTSIDVALGFLLFMSSENMSFHVSDTIGSGYKGVSRKWRFHSLDPPPPQKKKIIRLVKT